MAALEIENSSYSRKKLKYSFFCSLMYYHFLVFISILSFYLLLDFLVGLCSLFIFLFYFLSLFFFKHIAFQKSSRDSFVFMSPFFYCNHQHNLLNLNEWVHILALKISKLLISNVKLIVPTRKSENHFSYGFFCFPKAGPLTSAYFKTHKLFFFATISFT